MWRFHFNICLWLVFAKQLTGVTLGEVKPVDHMHQRKAEMARNADCFIALPGLSLSPPILTWSILILLFSDNYFLIQFNDCVFFLITIRRIWNSRRVIWSDHMVPAGNPQQTCGFDKCGRILRPYSQLHRQIYWRGLHLPFSAKHNCLCFQC